jgi:hypothetical protein
MAEPAKGLSGAEEPIAQWAIALALSLRDGGKDAPPDILVPLAALDELQQTAESVIAGQSDPPKSDRVSLMEDVALALGELGPALAGSVTPDLVAFQRNDLKEIPAFLSDVEGARRLGVAAEVLAGRLLTDAAVQAAWGDLLSAFENIATSEICELRIAQLKAIVERRGHDWSERTSQLAALLRDEVIAAVRVKLVEEPESWDEVDPRVRAGVPLKKRIEACQRVLTEPAKEAGVRAWFAFADAHIPMGYMRKGPIQLFDAGLFPDRIQDPPLAGSHDFVRPHELDDDFGKLHLKGVPEKDGVLAQVSLPPGPIAGALERAEHLLQGLVEIAAPDSGWRLMEGSSAWSEPTGWYGALGFHEPGAFERRGHLPPAEEGTAEQLKDLDDGLVKALTDQDEIAEEALRELRWDLAAQEADRPQRLALRMRTLERALPIPREARGAIAGAARRHLREIWSHWRLGEQLRDMAWSSRSSTGGVDKETRKEIERLADEMVRFEGGRIVFHMGQIIEKAPALAKLLPPESMHGRLTNEAARDVASGKALLERLARLDKMFDRLMARSVRQRNSVLHGAATVESIVESCQLFMRRLTSWMIYQALGSAGSGQDPLKQLEETRSRRLAERARLAEGEAPGEVLYIEDTSRS